MRHRNTAALVLAVCLLGREVRADERLVVDLFVNGQHRGEAVVLLKDDGWWMSHESWTGVGLPDLGGRREQTSGIEFLAMDSVAAITGAVVDKDAQTLHLELDPSSLQRTTINLNERAPLSTVQSRNTSAFFNYGIQLDDVGRSQVTGELGISIRGALLTAVATRNNRRVERGPVRMTFDNRRTLTRWTIGDTVATSGPLGSTLAVGGFGVAREFGIDPYFNRFQSTSFSGATGTPASVEVYRNGHLLRRDAVDAGPFTLVGLPNQQGAGEARIVVRDAFGAEQVWAAGYYQGSLVLPGGLQEFHHVVGLERRLTAARQPEYGRPVLLSSHRWGVTNHLTLGFGAEANRVVQAGGPSVAMALPVGELELVARASRSGRRIAFARSAAYSYLRNPFSLGARVHLVDRDYDALDVRVWPERTRTEATGYVATSLGGRRSLTIQHAWSRAWDSLPAVKTSATIVHPFTRFAMLSTTVARLDNDRGRGYEIASGLSVLLGSRTTASVTHTHEPARSSVATSLQRSLPRAEGWGYQLQVQDDDRAFGRVEYQNRFGRYAITSDDAFRNPRNSAHVAGALAVVGGRMYLSRPIQDAFGVVDLRGLDSVGVLVGNSRVGTTSRNGRLLIPDLLSYYSNDVSIASEEVPLEWDLASEQVLIAPGYRNGAVITFPVRVVQGFEGTVKAFDGTAPVAVAFETLIVDIGNGESIESPLGPNGEFYLENLAPGSYSAEVHVGSLRLVCAISVPQQRSRTVYLDDVVCATFR